MKREKRKAKIGEPVEVEIRGPAYRRWIGFGPYYDERQVEITLLNPIPEDFRGADYVYKYKITPKEKGKIDVTFGTGGCFGLEEKHYLIKLEVEE